jgi:hypothetical protein
MSDRNSSNSDEYRNGYFSLKEDLSDREVCLPDNIYEKNARWRDVPVRQPSSRHPVPGSSHALRSPDNSTPRFHRLAASCNGDICHAPGWKHCSLSPRRGSIRVAVVMAEVSNSWRGCSCARPFVVCHFCYAIMRFRGDSHDRVSGRNKESEMGIQTAAPISYKIRIIDQLHVGPSPPAQEKCAYRPAEPHSLFNKPFPGNLQFASTPRHPPGSL